MPVISKVDEKRKILEEMHRFDGLIVFDISADYRMKKLASLNFDWI